MKVELIKQEGNKVSFKLTVDHDKFESAVVKAYNKNKGKFNRLCNTCKNTCQK